MNHPILRALAALPVLAAALAGPLRAQTQTDPMTQRFIEELRLRGAGQEQAPDKSRGIRLRPTGDDQGAAPAGSVSAPQAPATSVSVNFPTNSARLTPRAERDLAPLGRALASAELAGNRFRIEGHTDTVGGPVANQGLSELRAQAVRDYFVRRFGVAASRLETVGLGESQPLVATPDETPEPRNRRVQVVNLGG